MNGSVVPVIRGDKSHSYVFEHEGARINILYASFFAGNESEEKLREAAAGNAQYELKFVLDGQCCLINPDGESVLICQNRFVNVISDKNVLFTDLSEDFYQFVILFDFDAGENSDFYALMQNLMQTGEAYNVSINMLSLIDMIENCIRTRKHEYETLIFIYLQTLFIEVSRAIVSDKANHLPVPYNNPRIKEAVRYIENNVSLAISVSDVARAVFMSEKQLKRIFLITLGVSVSDYIKRCKHKLARKLLAETEIPLIDIAEQTGFSEIRSFSGFFKWHEGISPAEYRKNMKSKNV